MSNKFLIGIGTAFFFVFVLGIGAVMSINSMSGQPSHPATTKAAEPSSDSSQVEVQSVEQPAPAAAPVANAPAVAPSSSAAVPVTVHDSDLAMLASAVKLGGTKTGDVSKEVWARETPIAEKLLLGLCDCDQRNWLNHFVKTGHEALSGSEDYYQSIQLLATLRRSDQELTAAQASH